MVTDTRRIQQARTHFSTLRRVMPWRDIALLVGNWALWRMLAERKIRKHVARLGPMPARLDPQNLPVTLPARSIWLLRQSYLEQHDQLRLVADMLQRSGHIVVATRSRSGYNTETVEELLQDNAQLLAEVAKEAKQRRLPIGLLGFSKGGCDAVMLAFHMLSEHGLLVRWLFTVSSPLQGSRLAAVADHEGARELSADHSRTGERLGKLYALEQAGMLCVPWCVRNDQVTRRKHAKAPWQWAIDLPGVWSHWGAPESERAMQVVANRIDELVLYHHCPSLANAQLQVLEPSTRAGT